MPEHFSDFRQYTHNLNEFQTIFLFLPIQLNLNILTRYIYIYIYMLYKYKEVFPLQAYGAQRVLEG
jgi:hypothetical protein